MKEPKVSICIACHNQSHLLPDALESCHEQDYANIEVIVLDDASNDNPGKAPVNVEFVHKVKYFRSEEPSGSGGAFNKAMAHATGDFIVLLCADDVFTDPHVISDMVSIFNINPRIAHISRWYHQFIDGDPRPVRAWRGNDVIELANNPSGLAFRATSLETPGKPDEFMGLSNEMFVEAPSLVFDVMKNPANMAMIMSWDTVAVRIHQSTARNSSYYKKMWKTSPVEAWTKIGGSAIQRDYTSLIQIKNYYSTWAVIKECINFVRLRHFNILEPGFIFFALLSIFTPRCILLRLPDLYRRTFGRWTTKIIRRPAAKLTEIRREDEQKKT